MATIQTSIVMADNITSTLHNITSALNMTLTAFQGVQDTASRDVDVNAFDAIRGHINAATIATQQFQTELDNIQPPKSVPVKIEWYTPQNIEIFDGSGVQRYNKEIQSANELLSRMNTVQERINQRASRMDLLPPSAVNDINSMGSRIQALRTQIERVQDARIQVVGITQANAETQGFREQLNHALQTQEDLNDALNNMDVSAANAAYVRLNSIVDTTERNIRDNVSEQENFNAELRNGQKAADGLQGSIMKMAAAYLSVQGGKKVLDFSDTSAQTAARMELIVDDGGSVDALQDKIFLSAQRARADYQMTSDVISKLGMQAGNAFSSNDELIAFAEQLNKTFKIAGTDASGIQSTMYNLTQALSSGVLRGQDLNSVFSNAQPIIQNIADYLGVPAGQIRDMAADGELSASVVKEAMLAAADATNERFERMPQTFADVATGIKSNALMAFQPILTRLNEIANSPQFQVFADNAISALVTVAGFVMWIFDLVGAVGGFVADNWSLIAPVVYAVAAALAIYAGYLAVTNGLELISKGIKLAGVIAAYAKAAATGTEVAATTAATAAQWGLNTALLACPLTWIIIAIIAIIAIIYLVVAAVNKFAGTSVSATGIIFGAFAWLGSVIANIFMGLLEIIFGVINFLVNPFIQFTNFLANIFVNPISSIIYLFQGLADVVLGILQKIASALDFVFGSNMAGAVQGWRDGLKSAADAMVAEYAPNENYTKVIDELDLSVANTLGWNRFDNTDAFDAGYALGESVEDSFSNFDPASLFDSNIPNAGDYTNSYDFPSMARDVADINSNTGDMKMTGEEDLKYLRDIAERETINRYFNIEMGGITMNNKIDSTMDLDGIVDYIGDSMMERLEVVAEGV